MTPETSRAQTLAEFTAQLVKERCLTGGAILCGPTPEECQADLVADPAELNEKIREARESGKYRFVAGAARQLYKGNDSVLATGYRLGDNVFARSLILLSRNGETWWSKSWVEPVIAEAA